MRNNGFRELIEDGRKEGIEWAKQIFKLEKEGLSAKEIAERLAVSEEQIKKVLE